MYGPRARASMNAQLGLDDARFYSSSGCDGVPTAHAGFASNAALLAHLVSICPHCFDFGTSSARTVVPMNGTAPTSAPRLLCRAIGTSAQVGGYAYDRKAAIKCGSELRVRPGMAFTVITLLGPRPEEFSPVLDTPDDFEIHSYWNLLYIPEGDAKLVDSIISARLLTNGTYDLNQCSDTAPTNPYFC